MRQFTAKDGTERRNPIRNMIDYIITRHTDTDSDNKMVKVKANIKGRSLYKRNTKKRVVQVLTANFKNLVMCKKYEEETAKINVPNELPVQEKWDIVVKKMQRNQ